MYLYICFFDETTCFQWWDHACCKIAKAEGHCCLPFLIHVTLNISKFENPSPLSHSNHQVEWSYHHQEYWEIVVLTHHKRRVCLFQGSPWLWHKLTWLWQNVFCRRGRCKEIICSDVPNGSSCKFFEREDLMAKPTLYWSTHRNRLRLYFLLEGETCWWSERTWWYIYIYILYIYIYIYIYIYTHTHTHTHIYIYIYIYVHI